ncbi:hypothetical protein [Nocardia sp. XZ_19_385]|uniref:hypothetical protein n=1 Tax=Nocardia sp. XZ_19_385 TaxID=2769488 RepID=UPI00188E060F|nr:hypothetical protein [Nocardia sp. XZ_19_385]
MNRSFATAVLAGALMLAPLVPAHADVTAPRETATPAATATPVCGGGLPSQPGECDHVNPVKILLSLLTSGSSSLSAR